MEQKIELRIVDPKALIYADNRDPRQVPADRLSDAALKANSNAIGFLQPPLFSEQEDGSLTIIAGRRRIRSASNEYGSAKLPKGATRVWGGKLGKKDRVALTIDPRNGAVNEFISRPLRPPTSGRRPTPTTLRPRSPRRVRTSPRRGARWSARCAPRRSSRRSDARG